MSRGACIVLGIFVLLVGAGFIALGWFSGALMPRGPLPMYGLGAFCGVIGAACLIQGSRAVTLRIIGGLVFAAYAAFAYHSITTGTYPRALAGFFIFGLPGGYLMIYGGYPSWGREAHVFRANSDPKPQDQKPK